MTSKALTVLTPEDVACCAPVTGDLIDEGSAETVARMFKALGDTTRVRLLSMIAATEGHEACLCDLTEPTGLAQPTVSHHMKLLVDAGLVTREQRGRWAYFRIVPGILESLATILHPAR